MAESEEAEGETDECAAETPDPATLQERIEEIQEERDELAADLEAAEEEIEDLTDRLKRKAADFENFKKRQQREQDRRAEEAIDRLLGRFLDVRDNLQRAIDEETEDAQALREGVKMTLAGFDQVLDAEGVVEISPDPGDAVDPARHEVMMRTTSEEPEGDIADVYQVGYERDETVLRSAQVAVSEGTDDEE